MKGIANDDLAESYLPPPSAHWDVVEAFALTFNGFDFWGSFEKCAEVANSQLQDTLTELRTCLFFEQRRWRHFGYEPDVEALRYIHSLVEKIRAKVQTVEHTGTQGSSKVKMAVVNGNHIDDILNQFNGHQFTTLDFITKFKKKYPKDWTLLEKRYGQGGSGGGTKYSANSYIALRLNDRRNRGELILSGYETAPVDWGHAKIARWSKEA